VAVLLGVQRCLQGQHKLIAHGVGDLSRQEPRIPAATSTTARPQDDCCDSRRHGDGQRNDNRLHCNQPLMAENFLDSRF